jgi:hypothetical protein
VRFRQEALFPCLHPCLPADVPLQLELRAKDNTAISARWQLVAESSGFELLTDPGPAATDFHPSAQPLRGAGEHCSTVDLRL